MKSRLLVATALFFSAVTPGRPQDKPGNPFRDAAAGDYVLYKANWIDKAGSVEFPTTLEVRSKSEKEVTLACRVRGLGGVWTGHEIKIDLSKPYDPIAAAVAAHKIPGVKLEKTGEGKETIKVGEKTFQCKWVKGELISEAGGRKSESEVKVWFSKAVPLTGMVKWEGKSAGVHYTLEFWKSGSEKK